MIIIFDILYEIKKIFINYSKYYLFIFILNRILNSLHQKLFLIEINIAIL